VPPAVRKYAVGGVEGQLQKYAEVIADPNSPIRGLEIVTNDRGVAVYWYGRMEHLGIPGRVRIDP
jgi:hypothetical protein